MPSSNALDTLRRPKLLVRAARHGLSDYNRERDLRRLIGCSGVPSPARVTAQLLDLEAKLEQRRRTGEGVYEPTRHIEVLVALMAESRLAANSTPPLSTKSMPLGWRVVDGRETRR